MSTPLPFEPNTTPCPAVRAVLVEGRIYAHLEEPTLLRLRLKKILSPSVVLVSNLITGKEYQMSRIGLESGFTQISPAQTLTAPNPIGIDR